MRGGYPQFGNGDGGSKLNSIDLAYLKDLDISSTTESQAPSTLPPNNKEVESCTSFEYHENGIINSPFQREIQRLLDSSSSKIPVPVSRTGGAVAGTSGQRNQLNGYNNYRNNVFNGNASGRSNSGRGNPSMNRYEFESVEKPNNYMQVMMGGGGGGASGGKHPVGLEAIKEIAKNTTASDSSHMQTSDTESCEMLQEIIDEEADDRYDQDGEYYRNDDSDLVNSKTINDILKYGAGHHSMDSNPGECTQSEWSDEDEKEDDEAKGTIYMRNSIDPQR